MSDTVEFTRDTEVVQIPAGKPIVVPKGTVGRVTQYLGGTYTLSLPASGSLVRLSGADAAAIGREPGEAEPALEEPEGTLEERVRARLETCFDPEIPVNIIDLGLVYDLQISDSGSGGQRVDVKMTLTAPGCGMGETIAADARDKILSLEGVDDADVAIVWDPPWNARMISDRGRAILKI